MTDINAKLAAFSAYFNDRLPSLFRLPDGREKKVAEAMLYSVSNGGKRVRPFLVASTAKIFGIGQDQSFITAAALECLHSYSLIHDDLPAMDNDDLRRGKPTCHKQFGEAVAILAGDGLLTYAFELISSEANHFPTDIKCRLVNLLANAAGAFNGMVAGQMLDLDTETSIPETDQENAIKRIEEMKTGRLLRFAVEAGAVLGNAPADKHRALIAYSRKIGIAFQIADDILDVEGTVEQMGKTLGKDAAQGKLTFVSLYGLAKAKTMAADLVAEAKDALREFGPEADDLRELADFIVCRRR